MLYWNKRQMKKFSAQLQMPIRSQKLLRQSSYAAGPCGNFIKPLKMMMFNQLSANPIPIGPPSLSLVTTAYLSPQCCTRKETKATPEKATKAP